MLELRGISKIYNPGTVTELCLFENFSFKVADGEFVSVVGSNGSGKTSMLNIICGSIPVSGGEVLIDGKNINSLREYKRYRMIGRVYQNPAAGTCPDMTILENMSLADNKGRRYGLSFGVNNSRKNYYKEQLSSLGLGLEDKLDVKLGALSGGQRQAVSLLMATLTPIDFLILDEHTAALDPNSTKKVLELTDKITSNEHITTLMITHDLDNAIKFGNRLIMLNNGKIQFDIFGSDKKCLLNRNLSDMFKI